MTILLATANSIIADRRTTAGGLYYDGGSKLTLFKSHKPNISCVIGTTGNASTSGLFLDWFMDNFKYKVKERHYDRIPFEPKDNGDAFSALVLYSDGKIGEFYNSFRELQVLAPVHAHGSGREYALGNYLATNDIVQACRAAVHYCTECGGGFDYYYRINNEFNFEHINE